MLFDLILSPPWKRIASYRWGSWNLAVEDTCLESPGCCALHYSLSSEAQSFTSTGALSLLIKWLRYEAKFCFHGCISAIWATHRLRYSDFNAFEITVFWKRYQNRRFSQFLVYPSKIITLQCNSKINEL